MRFCDILKSNIILQTHSQHWGDIAFRSFDQVTVQLSLDRSNVQREKLVFKLVTPHIPGFSVPSQHECQDVEMGNGNQTNNSEDSQTATDELGKNSKKKRKRKSNVVA